MKKFGKRLKVLALGIIGVFFLTSVVLAWYGGNYPGAQQAYGTKSQEIADLKAQISKKQAELSAIYAQKNPDPKKIAQLKQELSQLYYKLNQLYYPDQARYGGGNTPVPPASGYHVYHGHHGCCGCPWW